MTYQYRRGIVPLSGDPGTFGHRDLVRRAAERCEEVLVFIAMNDQKRSSYLFSLDERRAIAERLFRSPRVRVIASDDLLTDVYLRKDCDAVIRGVRNAEDRRFEEEQMAYHALILPAIADRIVYLDADPAYALVSSSLVKSFTARGLDVSPFVPVFVKEQLEMRINGQCRIGITGTIASGKTYVGERLARSVREEYGIGTTFVSIDALVRELYRGTFPAAAALRTFLAEHFGGEVLAPDGLDVNRTLLARHLFDPACPDETRRAVHERTAPLVHLLYRHAVAHARGLIVIEWAQLAEMHLGPWVNNRTIVVESPDRARFAATRNLTPERLSALSHLQWSAEEKLRALETQVERDGHGSIIHYVNKEGVGKGTQDDPLRQLAREVVSLFPFLSAQKEHGHGTHHRTV